MSALRRGGATPPAESRPSPIGGHMERSGWRFAAGPGSSQRRSLGCQPGRWAYDGAVCSNLFSKNGGACEVLRRDPCRHAFLARGRRQRPACVAAYADQYGARRLLRVACRTLRRCSARRPSATGSCPSRACPHRGRWPFCRTATSSSPSAPAAFESSARGSSIPSRSPACPK